MTRDKDYKPPRKVTVYVRHGVDTRPQIKVENPDDITKPGC